MKNKAIHDILSDFNPNEPCAESELKKGAPLTIWLPARDKARYDKLQKMSGRKFSKKVREVIQAVLDMVEEDSRSA